MCRKTGSGIASGSESGSISQRHGSADPDPHKNVMDPQHWCSANKYSVNMLKPKREYQGSGSAIVLQQNTVRILAFFYFCAASFSSVLLINVLVINIFLKGTKREQLKMFTNELILRNECNPCSRI
jgi:hypothetical protein